MRKRLLAAGLLALAAALWGCGGTTTDPLSRGPRSEPRISGMAFQPTLEARSEARAEEVDFHGWRAIRLSNGLVEAVVVPAAGGRILSYRLGEYEYLWSNPAEYGKTYTAAERAEERRWPNFGGDKLWPAPQERWGGPPDPVGGALDRGQWSGEIVTRAGIFAEMRMVSPAEPEVTGLQATRSVRLYAGTTRLQVSDSFKNVSEEPVRWSLWAVTQLIGTRGAGAPGGEVRAYVPMTPSREQPRGYWFLAEHGDREQYQPLTDRLLEVKYAGRGGKVGVWATAGWIGYSDTVNGYAYVRRFPVQAAGEYPDGGSIAQVYTYGYTEGTVGCLELETLSPLRELKPGEEFSFVQDWYACRVGAPLVEAGEVAVISEPLRLETAEQGYRLRGMLGVFAPGRLRLEVLDASGQPVGEPAMVAAGPEAEVTLDRAISAPPGASGLRVTLENALGTPLGTVARLALPGRAAPE